MKRRESASILGLGAWTVAPIAEGSARMRGMTRQR